MSGFFVERVEINTLFMYSDYRDQPAYEIGSRVGEGDPVLHPGRDILLAIKQHPQDIVISVFRKLPRIDEKPDQFFQNFLLVSSPETVLHPIRRE